jgi:fructokinase
MSKSVRLQFGAIEAGGTNFVCGVGTGPEDLRTTRIPTTSPDETIARAVSWFRAQASQSNPSGGLASVGIASFGPVELDSESPAWGHITNTPKSQWRNFDFAGTIRQALGVPVAFDTDVNAALLGEVRWGAARGISSCMYLTVGTGIGGGAVASGQFLSGSTHPEMGHIRVPRDSARDPFPGNCPFHGDCLEGSASGPAIAARWGAPAENLPPNHPAWVLEADYLAQALTTYVCILSPRRILLGGGVMRQSQLFPLIRTRLKELLAGYLPLPEVLPPELGREAGVLGAIALARSLAITPAE